LADRIPVDRSRIGVQDAGRFGVSVPEAADSGRIFAGAARSLLAQAEPIFREKAEREAIAAAGIGSIVKVGAGFEASAPPPGGGSVYMQTYDKVMHNRLLHMTTKDYEIQLSQLQGEHADDPQAFLAAAQGLAEGTIKASTPAIAADLEINLARELGERFRGLAEQKVRRDHAALVNGLEATISANAESVMQILETGVPDRWDRAAIPHEQAMSAIDDLENMGVLDEAGADAKRLSLTNLFGPVERRAFSENVKAGFGSVLTVLSDEELATVAMFGNGMTNGSTIMIPDENGKDVEVGLEEFNILFPDRVVANQVGAIAGNALTTRIAAQRAADEAAHRAEMERLAQANINTLEDVRREMIDMNRDPALGYTAQEVGAFEAAIMERGSIYDQMQAPGGRDWLLNFVADTGYVPDQLVSYIEARMAGGNFAEVVDFVQDMRTFNGRGTDTGQLAYERLDASTRASLELEEQLRRAGMPEEQRYQALKDARSGRTYTDGEARALFGNKQGERYDDVRAQALLDVFKIPAARGNPQIQRDYDTMFKVNLQYYSGDIQRAAKATARMVNNAWATSSRMVGGFAPRRLVNAAVARGITWGDIARAVPGGSPEVRRAVQTGNYKIKAESDNPAQGYGVYVLIPSTADGRPLPAVRFDMDDVMRDLQPRVQARQQATRAAAERTAIVEGPRWRMARDAEGKVRYMSREERLRIFDEGNK